jgi:hypothetical protein
VSQVKPESISLENLKFLSSQNYTTVGGQGSDQTNSLN